MRSLVSITALNVSAILPGTPVQFSGSRAEKSPRLNAISAVSNGPVCNSFPLVCERLRDRVFWVTGVFFIGWGRLKKRASFSRSECDAQHERVHYFSAV